MPDPALPPLSFLLEASPTSLQDLELASLNRSRNLARTVRSEIEQWIEQEAAGMLARWMIKNREALLAAGAAIETPDLTDVFNRKSA
jgi:hypothetical protein